MDIYFQKQEYHLRTSKCINIYALSDCNADVSILMFFILKSVQSNFFREVFVYMFEELLTITSTLTSTL